MPLSLNRKKSIRTVSILVLIVLTLFPVSRTLLFERHLFNIVDSTATEYVDQGLKPAEEERWWKSMSDLPGMSDVKAKIEAIKKTALEMIDKIIDLIVVFVLSTIALPLLFLWGFIKLGRLIFVQGFSVVAGERPAEK